MPCENKLCRYLWSIIIISNIIMLCKLDANSFVPNVIKNNIILPAKAFAQTSIDSLREPVGNILSSVQKKYADELTKSEREYTYT